MTEECCAGMGCGCNATSIYTDMECPTCGRKLRVTGDLQRIQLWLTCQDCGYQSHQLSLEDLRQFID